jgi:transcriptional regulator with XRE-family HTH domain
VLGANIGAMPPVERPFDRGRRLGLGSVARLGAELRDARVDRGLTVDAVAAAAGISNASVSRIERGLAPRVPLTTLVLLGAIVGLDVVIRTYPGANPVRDSAHVALLADLRRQLHKSLRWATEVPLPTPGDQRAWDAMILGPGWRIGVEAETRPRDAQAIVRRLNLKQRDGEVDSTLLILRDSRATREFCRGAADELTPAFPLAGARVLELLRAGVRADANAMALIPRTAFSRPPIRRA